MNEQTKKTLIIIFAIVAILLAGYSAYRSFRQEEGKVIQTIDMIPGGKAGEIQRQQEGGGQEMPPTPPR